MPGCVQNLKIDFDGLSDKRHFLELNVADLMVFILIVSLSLFRLKGESAFAAHRSILFLPQIDDSMFYPVDD